jgi:hypothetical protein
MELILKGLANYLITADTAKKFKVITYSEFLDELIAKNQTPFIDIIGLQETKKPFDKHSMKSVYSRTFEVTIVIVQDAKVTKDIIHGSKTTESIWSLADYVYGLINADRTFGGLIDRIAEKEVISKITTLTKDNSIKLALEMELTLVVDRVG